MDFSTQTAASSSTKNKPDQQSPKRTFGPLNPNTPSRMVNSPRKSKSKASQGSIKEYFVQKGSDVTNKIEKTSTVEKSVQTESKCECDFYDETGLEMMSSEHRSPKYFQNLAKTLQPKVDKIQDHKFELESELGQIEEEKEKLKQSIQHSYTVIEIGQKLAQEVQYFHENVRPIIMDDSGMAEMEDSRVEESESSSKMEIENSKEKDGDFVLDQEIQEMLEEQRVILVEEMDCQVSDFPSSKQSTNLQNKNEDSLSSSDESCTKNIKNKPNKRNRYFQASLCCVCDWSNDDHMNYMCQTDENDEFAFMMKVNQLRMTKKMCQELIEVLECEVSEGKKSLEELIKEDKELLEQRKDVYELTDRVDSCVLANNSTFDDSGLNSSI